MIGELRRFTSCNRCPGPAKLINLIVHPSCGTEHCVACSNQTQTARASQNVDSSPNRCLSTPTPPPPISPVDHRTFSRTSALWYAEMRVGECDVIPLAKYTMQNSSAYGWQSTKLCLAPATNNFKWVKNTRNCLIWGQIFANRDA